MRRGDDMKSKMLSINWFVEGRVDVEQKQYILLDYLKTVGESYRENKLYPCFSNVIDIYQNLVRFQTLKEQLSGAFPHELQGVDWKNAMLIYETVHKDDETLQSIETLIRWSIPLLKEKIEEGKCIYEFVQDNMQIGKVGIIPLYISEGYFCIRNNENATLDVFEYGTSIYTNPSQEYRSVYFRYLLSFRLNLSVTPESVKLELIRKFPKLPNPVIYYADTDLDIPFQESILPVAKRKFLEKISRERKGLA